MLALCLMLLATYYAGIIGGSSISIISIEIYIPNDTIKLGLIPISVLVCVCVCVCVCVVCVCVCVLCVCMCCVCVNMCTHNIYICVFM